MHNYQLYRTNPLLSGQVKWCVSLGKENGILHVSGFNLDTISPIVYNRFDERNLLKHTHLENLAEFYRANSNLFYSTITNSAVSDYGDVLYPIVEPTKTYLVTDKDGNTTTVVSDTTPEGTKVEEMVDISQFSTTYNMGIRRLSYRKWGKQFEFLCPVWLENTEGKTLCVRFDKYLGNTMIGTEMLKLEASANQIHNTFCGYLNKYINDAQLNIKKGEDIMLIDCPNGIAKITGIDAKNGIFVEQNINELALILGSQEYPKLQFDNYIIKSFKDRGLICKQLINFSFMFNIEDIFTEKELNLSDHNALNVKVAVELHDGDVEETLECKDFYTNYEYIPSIHSILPFLKTKEDDAVYNVLSYKRDYDCVDMTTVNKMMPRICHWSMSSNDNYIFNLYKGFGVRYGGFGETVDDTPHTKMNNYNKYSQNLNWCDHFVYTSLDDINKVVHGSPLSNTEDDKFALLKKFLSFTTPFTPDKWKNGILYKGLKEPFKFCVIHCHCNPEDVHVPVEGKFAWTRIDTNPKYSTYWINVEGSRNVVVMCLGYPNLDDEYYLKQLQLLTFFNIFKNNIRYNSKALTDQNEDKSLFYGFTNESPNYVQLRKLLTVTPVEGPSMDTTEISYRTTTTSYANMLRYFGNIRPTFVPISNDTIRPNVMYFRKVITQTEYINDNWALYKKHNFAPKYPSIGYCPYGSAKMVYDRVPHNMLPLPLETFWFDNGKMLNIPSEITSTVIWDQNNGRKTIKDLAMEVLRDYFSYYQEDTIDYIAKLYDYEGYGDYNRIDSITEYKYEIKLTLK